MPVSMGLVGTPSSMVAVAFGTVTYQVLHFISENAETLAEGGSGDSKIGQFKTIIDAFITDKTAIVLAVSFASPRVLPCYKLLLCLILSKCALKFFIKFKM